jgi:hypothetical protein
MPTARAGWSERDSRIGAFAENSADVHELVVKLADAGAHKAAQKYLLSTHQAKGAAKALLYTAPGQRPGEGGGGL